MNKSAAIALLSLLTLPASEPPGRWSGFRGSGDSVTEARNLPLHWSERHNFAWAVDLPGFGQSTPVTANGAIYLTAIEGAKKESLVVLCLDAASGKEKWRKSFPSSRPQEAGDRTARAAPTPALDDNALYAVFDSGDVFALSLSGQLLWKKNFNTEFAPIQNGHDFGSSPRQSRSSLFVFVNHVGPSYLVAIDKKSGATRWRVDFGPEGGWTTPVLTRHQDRDVLLVQRTGGVAAYNPDSGALLWEDLRTFSRESAIPSLSVRDGVVVTPSNAKGGTWAFSLEQPKNALWKAKAATNGFSSPLVTAKRAYFVNSVGALFAVDLASGRDLWSTRLESTTWASAIAAGDRVYFFTGDGAAYAFRDSDSLEPLGESRLDTESLVYAVTPLDDAFLIRTGRKLRKVVNKGEKDPLPPAKKPVSANKPALPDLPPAPPGKPGDRRVNKADGLTYAWIPAGRFLRGCSAGDARCEADEKPAHPVTLTRGFWIQTTEVTVEAYRKSTALPAEAPSWNPNWENPKLPMVRVDYAAAAAYCRWAGGRLPSEAEWEYAARAGVQAPTYADLPAIAWSADNSGRQTLDSAKLAAEQRGAYMPTLRQNGNRPHPPAEKSPNAFGLFDILGNVAEWTADWHDLYSATPVTDPRGPADGEKRIARGGTYSFPPASLRASARLKLGESNANDFTGIRCVQ